VAKNIIPNLSDEPALKTQAGSSDRSVGRGAARFWVEGRYLSHGFPDLSREHIDKQLAKTNYLHPNNSSILVIHEVH
jgi:hypothetical protein